MTTKKVMDAEDVLDLILWMIKDMTNAEEIRETITKVEKSVKEKKVEQLKTDLFLFE